MTTKIQRIVKQREWNSKKYTNNPKEGRKKEVEQRRAKTNMKNSKIVDLNLSISTINIKYKQPKFCTVIKRQFN